MPSKNASTEVPAASVEIPASTADVAARRRNRKSAVPAEHPTGAPPAPVDGTTPVAVIASRTTVSGFVTGSPARPVGGVWMGEPLVLETMPGAVGGIAPENPRYVIAACDAEEHVVPPGCYTPVSRLLWRRGYRVRRDLYERVMAEHAARVAADIATVAPPAALPPGIDAPPADALVDPPA